MVGRYDEAGRYWTQILPELDDGQAARLTLRLAKLKEGITPQVPAVDYLEGVALAFAAFERGEYEETAAILTDVLDDPVFREEFPLPELFYVLGASCSHLALPAYAKEYLEEALRLRPDYAEARSALDGLVR